MAHEHDWIDVTAIGDLESQYVCSGCDARRSGDGAEPRDIGAASGERKHDGWDGMRRFLKQMGERPE